MRASKKKWRQGWESRKRTKWAPRLLQVNGLPRTPAASGNIDLPPRWLVSVIASTPIIANKKASISLLAPNNRPQQITQNIRDFWKQLYSTCHRFIGCCGMNLVERRKNKSEDEICELESMSFDLFCSYFNISILISYAEDWTKY